MRVTQDYATRRDTVRTCPLVIVEDRRVDLDRICLDKLHAFALRHGLDQFAALCDAALAGDEDALAVLRPVQDRLLDESEDALAVLREADACYHARALAVGVLERAA